MSLDAFGVQVSNVGTDRIFVLIQFPHGWEQKMIIINDTHQNNQRMHAAKWSLCTLDGAKVDTVREL